MELVNLIRSLGKVFNKKGLTSFIVVLIMWGWDNGVITNDDVI